MCIIHSRLTCFQLNALNNEHNLFGYYCSNYEYVLFNSVGITA